MDNRLLLRYIMGKAGRSERRRVADWLKESPENMDRFSSLKAQYVFSGMPNSILPEKRRVFPAVALRFAAILSIPLLAGAIYLYVDRNKAIDNYLDASRRAELLMMQNPGSVTYVANAGTKSTVVLPDSSIVHLNGKTKLTVPQAFNPDVRDLMLSGEGYFEVRHHDDWPMQIRTTKGVTVKVLGTTFDLSAYEDDADVKVTLVEGRVQVKEDKTGFVHEIKPSQEIRIVDNASVDSPRKELPVIKRADIHKNTAWVKGELIFDNTPMPEIVKQLERWYGVNIKIIDEDILNYRLTATFSTESITRVLDLIKFSSMLEYRINGTDVIIRKGRS